MALSRLQAWTHLVGLRLGAVLEVLYRRQRKVAALLTAIASPLWPGAACIGKWVLFDLAAESDGQAQSQALAVCRHCPALARCAKWAEGQKFELGTVVGGMVISPQKKPNPAVRSAVQSLTIAEKADLLVEQWRARPKRAV